MSDENASSTPETMPSPPERPGPDRRRVALTLGTLAAIGLVAAGAVRGYADLSASKKRVAALKSEIEATHQRIEELGVRVDTLEDDPVVLEWLAREELGLTRPGEVVLALAPDLR